MPSGGKLNYLCKGSNFYDLKLTSEITQQEHRGRGQQGVWSNIGPIYMLALGLYVLNYFLVCRI